MVKQSSSEQLRQVMTEHGPITYFLVRKRVKNLNLRVSPSGKVTLSIPYRCPMEQADRLVQERAGWIAGALARQQETLPEVPEQPSRDVCKALAAEATARVYPLVQPFGVAFPEVRVRNMRSQWGNCHWHQGYITLNLALFRCPKYLQDYVALHELVHFLHHDHGAGFYAAMDQLMPRWREYRRELKGYAGIIEG